MTDSGPPFSLMVSLASSIGPILVVGGGPVGLRKIRTLLKGGARVDLVAPEAVSELVALAEEGVIGWERRTVRREDFLAHSLALLALPPEATKEVLPLARATGCLLNCCGHPRRGQWSLAAQFHREGFTVGVSSGGGDPGGSAALKNRLQGLLEAHGEEEP